MSPLMNPRDDFGSLTVAAVVAAGAKLAKVMPLFVRRIRDGKMVARLRERRAARRSSLEQELKRERGLHRGATGLARKRHRQRVLELNEAVELERLRSSLGEAGFDGSSPFEQGLVKELRRNQLAEDWDAASPARRAEIEGLVAKYDAELDLLRTQVPSGSVAVYSPPALCPVRVTLGLLGVVALGGVLMRNSRV